MDYWHSPQSSAIIKEKDLNPFGFKSHRARQKQAVLAKSIPLQTALPTGLWGCQSHCKQLNYAIEFDQVKVYMAGVPSLVNG